jgi:hypothetical protein
MVTMESVWKSWITKINNPNYLQYMTNFTEGLMEGEKYPIARRQRACRYGKEQDHRVSK